MYKGVRKSEPKNYTMHQLKELQELKRDQNVIVKQSDKCKNLVIMDTEEYITKAKEITRTYENVTKNPTPKLEQETKALTKRTLKNKIPDDYLQKILPQHTRTAEFYGLPKTHKFGNPLRPIVSACGDPLDKLSWFLQNILTQILQFIPAHLTNTESYLSRMKSLFPAGLPSKSIVFSLDVANLYGSIPIQEGINAVMDLIETNLSKVNTYGTTVKDIRCLLTHVLNNNFLRFDSQTFKQVSGIAMGNRLAPPVAIAFMHSFETAFLSTLTYVPMLYVRYIDDILGVWTHGLDRLNHFVNLINTHHPSIRFTMEHTENTGTLAFLDTLITVFPSGKYTTELYFKPMAAPIILHYTSAHPKTTKKAVLNAEIHRALRVSSDHDSSQRSLNAVKQLFIQNGYPDDIVNRTIKNIRYRKREPKEKAHQKNIQIYMRLPYVNETIVSRVNGILRSSKTSIKPAWTNENTLKKKLVNSAFVKPPCPSGNKQCHTCTNGLRDKCNTKNAIYQITCNICQSQQQTVTYVGESTRPIRYRFNEHLSDARLRKTDTPLGEHILDKHSDLDNIQINKSFSIKLLDTGKDCADVKIKESLHIKKLKPQLNTMTSSWPLTR